MTDTPIELPADIHHLDEDEKALAGMPSLDDRIKYHTKKLWGIAKRLGTGGVAVYKSKYPEAKSLRVDPNPRVSRAKPEGFDDYLVNLATRWLTSDAAAASTNTADVKALNERFGTSRFNPAKQFSLSLSKQIKTRMREAFAAQGTPLDIDTIKCMTDVRNAAKAARAGKNVDRHIGPGLIVSDDKLTIGGDTYTVSRNGKRECIRVRIKGSIRRLYLDEMGWLADRLANPSPSRVADTHDPLHTSYFVEVRECDYLPESPDLTASAGSDPGDCDYSPDMETDTGPIEPRSLSERLAALTASRIAAERAHSSADADDPDADPLSFS